MKKVLSTVLALGFVAGAASLAAAADPVFTMNGFYTVEGIYATNMTVQQGNNVTPGTAVAGVNVHPALGATGDKNAAWFQQNFRINPKLSVNDKVDLFSEIRLADDQVWGNFNGGESLANVGNRGIDFKKLYMEYKSPVGMLRIGRNPFGSYGVSKFLDTATSQDGVTFFPEIAKPFNAAFVYAKLSETDAFTGTVNDQDSDYYDGRFGYQDAAINAALSLRTTLNHSVAAVSDNKHSLRGFGKYNIDKDMNVSLQFDHAFGTKKTDAGTGTTDVDYNSTAVYADFNGTFSGVSVGVLGWWLTGDDNATDDKNNAFGALGKDFEPLLIATGHQMGLLNSYTTSNYSGLIATAGQKAVGAYVSYPVSSELTVVGVLGSAWADDQLAGWDAHMGWEADANASYKLLDNLTYSVGAGYFKCGSFFDGANGALSNHESNIVLLKNNLNMTF